MADIKKKVDFPNAVTHADAAQVQELNAQADVTTKHEQPKGINPGEYDTIEKDFIGQPKEALKFAVRPEGVNPNALTLGGVLNELKTDMSALNTDKRALEYVSTAPCEASSVVLTPDQESRVESVSAIAATLENTSGMNTAKIPYATRKQLADIADAMKDLPTPDAVTYADKRKVMIPSEVRDVPNKLSKEKSMILLEKIVGDKLAAQAILCAQTGGQIFFQKPALWLSQRLSYELSKRDIYDKVDLIKDYDAEQDANNEAIAPKALAMLFSWHVVEQLQIVARVRQIGLIHATKLMIERICEQAVEEKRPKDYSEKYDNTASLEQLIAS